MILTSDAWESDNEENEWLVDQACTIFREMQIKGVHKLAELAFSHITASLARLGLRRHKRKTADALS